jgi:GTP-binding protein
MSTYGNVKFLTSAARTGQLVDDVGREVAFAGRSNAGKSTAINAITQRVGLARVSRTPGRTQLINFFEFAPRRRLVDLPGYGFAKVPNDVRRRWLELMRRYFDERGSLVGLVLIVDSRRGLGEHDVAMLEWALAKGRRAHVLLTKADKLNRQEAVRVLRETTRACAATPVSAQLFSAHARQGLDEARALLDGWFDGADLDGTTAAQGD